MIISLNNPASAKFLWECSRTKSTFSSGIFIMPSNQYFRMFHPFKCEPCHSRNVITCLSMAEFDAFPGWVVVTWWITAMGMQGLAFTLGVSILVGCQHAIYISCTWIFLQVMESFSCISLSGRTGLGGRFLMRTGGYGTTRSHHQTRKACSHLDGK